MEDSKSDTRELSSGAFLVPDSRCRRRKVVCRSLSTRREFLGHARDCTIHGRPKYSKRIVPRIAASKLQTNRARQLFEFSLPRRCSARINFLLKTFRQKDWD